LNYFGHYYFDHRLNNQWYNLGLVLPDLIHSKSINFKKVVDSVIVNKEEHAKLIGGISSHLKRDGLFHDTDSFHSLNKSLLDELASYNKLPKPLRLFYVSHVLLELMIDKSLAIKNPTLVQDMYKDINACKNDDLVEFLALIKLPEPSKFLERLNEFIINKYTIKTTEQGGLSHAIFNISRRIFNLEQLNNHINEHIEFFDDLYNRFELDIMNFIDEIKLTNL
jgi:hypothetical protein